MRALSNALYARCEHSSTLPLQLCSLFTVPTCPIWSAVRTQQDIVAASLDISFYHPNRQTRCCSARLRCSEVLPVEEYARGRLRRLQIPLFLSLFDYCLSLITFSNHSSRLVHLCLHSLRHSLFLLSTHSDTLCYSPKTVFTTTHYSPWLPTGVFFLVSSFPSWHAQLPLLS